MTECLECTEYEKSRDIVRRAAVFMLKDNPKLGVCQTPGAIYSISIRSQKVSVIVALPEKLDMHEITAEDLEKDLHDAIELVLAKYPQFMWKKD